MKTPVKAKISLTPPATFRGEVEIRTPGGSLAFINFDFKHREKASIKELISSLSPPVPADPEAITEDEAAAIKAFVPPDDVDVVMDIAADWDLDEEFNAKSVKKMSELYVNSVQATIHAYLAEMSGARAKN